MQRGDRREHGEVLDRARTRPTIGGRRGQIADCVNWIEWIELGWPLDEAGYQAAGLCT